MKKKITAILFLYSVFGYSQQGNVGINTTDPKATLDVTGAPTDLSKLDGVIPPRLTGDQLRSKTYTAAQNGAMVYVTAADTAPSGQTIEVTRKGLFFFDAAKNKWMKTMNTEDDKSIYVGNGTLTGERTVDTKGYNLFFSNLENNSFKISTALETSLRIITDRNAYASALEIKAGGTPDSIVSIETSDSRTKEFNITTKETQPINLQTNSTTRMTVLGDGKIGIGTTTPANSLHVVATKDPVRIEGLQTGNLADKQMLVQSDGTLKTTKQFQVETMRFGINGISTSTSYTTKQTNVLRFDEYNSDAELGDTPSGTPNFINTIEGASFTEGKTLDSFPVLPEDYPFPATRVTDVVNLPAGLYEITFRMRSSNPVVDSSGDFHNNIMISVNNNYFGKLYSVDGGIVMPGWAGQESMSFASTILSLSKPSEVDFLLEPVSYIADQPVSIHDVGYFGTVGGRKKQILKSEIIIKKLGTDTTVRP